MDSIFILKLILSFLIGGFWAIGITVVAEKYGTKLGGLLAGFPSTSLLALFFMGWTNSVSSAIIATKIVPIIFIVNIFFVVIYIILVKKNFILAMLGAVAWWLLVSGLIYYFKINNFLLALFIYFIVLWLAFLFLDKKLKIVSVKNIQIKHNISTLLFRGLLAGFIISLAVLLNKISGPLLGGIFGTFPAMFCSTMIITYRAGGADFSAATMKSSIIGGVTSIFYILVIQYFYNFSGLWLGTLIGIILTLLFSYCLFQVILKKIS